MDWQSIVKGREGHFLAPGKILGRPWMYARDKLRKIITESFMSRTPVLQNICVGNTFSVTKKITEIVNVTKSSCVTQLPESFCKNYIKF
jgi:hypothetical protein